MIETLLWILAGYGLTLFTWTFYLAVMKLRAAMLRQKLSPMAKFNAAVLIAIGVVPYVLFNWTVGSILFLEFPRIRNVRIGKIMVMMPEPQFTHRCKWHIREGRGWRKKQAEYWCKNMLDPFQEGGHC